jgi:hypothetical protein
MPTPLDPPAACDLEAHLGPAMALWTGAVETAVRTCPGLLQEWRSSKSAFGRLCLLRQKQRTLLYLLPEAGQVQVAIVLGARAYALALASGLPGALKAQLSEATPHVEGRGIRFPLASPDDFPALAELLRIKTARV